MRRPTLAFLLIVLVTAGCSYMMPPQKIPLDRRNYMDAVSTSWKEQLLTNLVMLRYGDTLTSLELISVTTGYELDAGLTANYPVNWNPLSKKLAVLGFRNVVSVGGSVIHMDKPTITYNPMKGDARKNHDRPDRPFQNFKKSPDLLGRDLHLSLLRQIH